MSRIKRIKFVCPECGGHKLEALRIETLSQIVINTIDTREELYMSDLVEEKDTLLDSEITQVFCNFCRLPVVTEKDDDTKELGVKLFEWLDNHNMLEDVEDPK